METIKILIVDDHTIIRQGLCKILEAEEDMVVVGEAKDGFDAISKVKDSVPDIVLMDIDMPRLDGIEATRLIKGESPQTKIIILTVHKDKEHLFKAIKSGAVGYLFKERDSRDLLEGIRAVAKGENLLSPTVATQLLDEFNCLSKDEFPEPAKSLFSLLTKREEDILNQIIAGKSNKEIADILYISESTVKSHIANIFQKLHVNSRTQAIVYALAGMGCRCNGSERCQTTLSGVSR